VLLGAAIAGALLQARLDEGRGEAAGAARTAGGADGVAPTTHPAMPVLAGGDARASTWYCAAGTGEAGGMADHTVTIFNPSGAALGGTMTVYGGHFAGTATPGAPSSPPPVERELWLPPRQAIDFRLGDVVDAPLVAALVEVGGGAVAVEHRVAGPDGDDAGPCASAASPQWHLATGATSRDAREVIVLFNPFPTHATVDVSFDTNDGPRQPLRFQGFPVAAGSVVGLDVGDDVTRKAQVSATVRTRTGRLVVERLQAFDGSLGPRGLSVALAAPQGATTWAFADGEAGGDRSERIVVYNPSDERAEVDVSVLPTSAEPGPAPQPFRLSVRGGGFTVVDYGEHERITAGIGHATVVHASNGVPVVAERVMTQTFDRGDDADDADGEDGGDGRVGDITFGPGSVLAARSWVFPSTGTAGVGADVDGGDPDVGDADGDGAAGDESGAPVVRFVVFNPDPDRRTRVSLRAVADGRSSGIDDAGAIEVAPGGRVTLQAPESLAPATALVVEADAGVVVERLLLSGGELRVATGAGIPAVEGSVALAHLAASGDLAGQSVG
jgi:hypothetical protein